MFQRAVVVVLAFLANAVAFGGLAAALRATLDQSRRSSAVWSLLGVASDGMVLSAAFPTDVLLSGAPITPIGTIHAIAALSKFACLAAGAVLSVRTLHLDGRRPELLRPLGVLAYGGAAALVAFVGASVSGLPVAGLAQRIVTVLLLGWVVVAAGWVARTATAPVTGAS
ncbi:DUF998 domain-containing protein [Actinoplanes sp. NPDC051346]|uniref:DUF998 domain-containing protein n=1 Tax=Actinoplanes sp. NPDC051346 TaxID=3155048 RepID=UPI00343EDE69